MFDRVQTKRRSRPVFQSRANDLNLARLDSSFLQPLCDFSAEYKMKSHIRFTQHLPCPVVGTKLDATLTHAVFVRITAGEGQEKGWKGIR